MSKPSMKPAVVAGVLVAFALILGLAFASARASDVPEWLARKLEWEAKYEEISKQWREKCAREVAELGKARAAAPKDEKGNPILPGEPVVLQLEPVPPRENIGVIETTVTVYIHSAARERYVFTTEAYAPYDVLIAGSDRQDGTIGVIFRVAFDPDPRKSVEIKEHRFPGKGPIAFESLEEDNQVVTFRWGTDGKGYFDLRNGTATFEEYRPER